jgi:glutaredoxin
MFLNMKKTIFSVITLVIVLATFQFGSEIQEMVFPKPNFAELHDGKVILYATSWCGYCKKTRQFLNENSISFYEYDIEKSAIGHDQYRAIGGRGVPVLLVNKNVIRGYNPDEILKYLDR